jgi:hypothetical protein
MAVYTQLEFDTLKSAVAQGALTVKYGDKEVTYRSLKDMLSLLEIMKTDLGLNGTDPVNRGRRYATFSKGL